MQSFREQNVDVMIRLGFHAFSVLSIKQIVAHFKYFQIKTDVQTACDSYDLNMHIKFYARIVFCSDIYRNSEIYNILDLCNLQNMQFAYIFFISSGCIVLENTGKAHGQEESWHPVR